MTGSCQLEGNVTCKRIHNGVPVLKDIDLDDDSRSFINFDFTKNVIWLPVQVGSASIQTELNMLIYNQVELLVDEFLSVLFLLR